MKQDQTSELSNKAKTAETEQQKTTPPTSQTNTHKTKPENISLPSSQKAGGTSKVTMRKRVRTLQTAQKVQSAYDDSLDEMLDDAYDEFVEANAATEDATLREVCTMYFWNSSLSSKSECSSRWAAPHSLGRRL